MNEPESDSSLLSLPIALFGIGIVFLHRADRLEPEPRFLPCSLAGLFVVATPFIVMVLRAGRVPWTWNGVRTGSVPHIRMFSFIGCHVLRRQLAA